MKKIQKQIGFIGGGHMGEAILAALLKKKLFSSTQIGLYEPDKKRAQTLKNKFKISVLDSNKDLVTSSRAILLAVKPQQAAQILQEIQEILTPQHVFISIAAGLDLSFFKKYLSPSIPLIRVMPNMCLMIGEGASVLYAPPPATEKDRGLAEKIFSAGGISRFVEREEDMDVVTALSGSGPAFMFRYIEAMINAGVLQKLKKSLSTELVIQTVIGAAKMILNSGEPIPNMIQKVASKGGTTEAGLQIMDQENFEDIIRKVIDSATQRAKELRCIS